jgi:hypothetical protein
MASFPNPQRIRGELFRLLEQQLSDLQKQVFGGLTEHELQEYERRRDRISELYDQLRYRQAAAA